MMAQKASFDVRMCFLRVRSFRGSKSQKSGPVEKSQPKLKRWKIRKFFVTRRDSCNKSVMGNRLSNHHIDVMNVVLALIYLSITLDCTGLFAQHNGLVSITITCIFYVTIMKHVWKFVVYFKI